ncbi:hypothetical protein ACFFU8_08915 [Chromobacterium piscinae]|uniref:hypothetical protein n=1 Tax=Chromobacterium piscinae TaxID=686831 RepID=UPI001E53B146|nr:hypothetical protein [Chromobacterium piscinae]MCD5327975.1 hypothetical protein [Chromobacterium piscinae]
MLRETLPSGIAQGWMQFVLENGWRALAYEMAAILGQPVEEIERVRRTGACRRLSKRKRFAELFALWHGRPPTDEEWPTPRKLSSQGTYEWQGPELALLANLVGQLGCVAIAQTLTNRLRTITGDPNAERNRHAVQLWINRIGMQSKDVLGGLTTAAAGREIGSLAVVQQAIVNKQLKLRRVGRLLVIPYAEWEAWKVKRSFPPEGYVRLSSLREALAIRSDKLSEFARMGLVPTAVRCIPYGVKGPSTQFGTWYIAPDMATQLLEDRRAGRAMPWHGKPLIDNLLTTFKLWQQRKHPTTCATCQDIWGEQGAPETFDDYAERYPPLAHGAKRHLTRVWNPGLTLEEVASMTGRSIDYVVQAVANGALDVSTVGNIQHVTRTNATRWSARGCPSGENAKSWISLETASKKYLFTLSELRKYIESEQLTSKVGTAGAARGVVYVSKNQCGLLREKIGFTEAQAARKVGVTIPELRVLLEGVNWRKAEGIPLVTVQAVIKRRESSEGYELDVAANLLGTTLQWIEARIADGTIKVSKAPWDETRLYITDPMMERLRKALHTPMRERLSDDWLRLSDAAHEAGVTTATILKWANNAELDRRKASNGWRYQRQAVRARARLYWLTVRFHRATPPDWLQAESTQHSVSVRPTKPN